MEEKNNLTLTLETINNSRRSINVMFSKTFDQFEFCFISQKNFKIELNIFQAIDCA